MMQKVKEKNQSSSQEASPQAEVYTYIEAYLSTFGYQNTGDGWGRGGGGVYVGVWGLFCQE